VGTRLSAADRRRLLLGAQVALGAGLVGFLGLEVWRSWGEIRPRVADMDWRYVALATLAVAVYYMAFVPGWMLLLRGAGMRLGYRQALGAEMLSMLAKYIPGGIWTPAARLLVTRRVGLPNGPVLITVLYEAGLSAIAGVVVFAVALPLQDDVRLPVPAWSIAAFAALLLVLMHPRVAPRVFDRLLRRIDGTTVPRLPMRTLALTFGWYLLTWLVSGVALMLMVRSVADIPLSSAPYLGGVSAIGAIVAVLVVFAPSGLGVREGATYLLLLTVVDPAGALVVVALNRLLITAVEIVLLAAVGGLGRGTRFRQELRQAPRPTPGLSVADGTDP
jgi:hypothetical protein